MRLSLMVFRFLYEVLLRDLECELGVMCNKSIMINLYLENLFFLK